MTVQLNTQPHKFFSSCEPHKLVVTRKMLLLGFRFKAMPKTNSLKKQFQKLGDSQLFSFSLISSIKTSFISTKKAILYVFENIFSIFRFFSKTKKPYLIEGKFIRLFMFFFFQCLLSHKS
jgi:hypothetical protein